jgi:hypothetical protein
MAHAWNGCRCSRAAESNRADARYGAALTDGRPSNALLFRTPRPTPAPTQPRLGAPSLARPVAVIAGSFLLWPPALPTK